MDAFLSRLRFWRDHRWAPNHMSAYLDGELTARRRGRMKRHVGECRECRRLIAGLSAVIEALHRLTPPAIGNASQITASVRILLRTPERP
jgi:anti-sigma factor RsiW